MIYEDQLFREIKILCPPKKIVSLVPSQTELLVNLGALDQVVGVTKFCVHPSSIRKQKKVVGGTKQVYLEKIKSLVPDIIFCNKEENTLEIVKELEKEFPVHVSDIITFQDSVELIAQYGDILDRKREASTLISDMQKEFQKFSEFIKNISIKKTAYFIWREPWMVVGSNTFIHHLLDMNHFENAFGHLTRYPEIDIRTSDELKNVDLILLSSEPFPFKEKHKDEMQNMFPNAEVLLVDGEYFSWYGSRLLNAFNYFRTLHF